MRAMMEITSTEDRCPRFHLITSTGEIGEINPDSSDSIGMVESNS
jgi:hypothetical protein